MGVPSRSTVEAILRHKLEMARKRFEAADAHLLFILEHHGSVDKAARAVTQARYERWEALEEMSRLLDQFSDAVLYGSIPNDIKS